MAYIRLDRKFFEGKFWLSQRSFSQAEAWLDLIQMARFEAETATIILANGRRISIKRGEIHASLRYLSTRWGWGVDKTRRFIDNAKKDGDIEYRSEQGESIIKLCNYDLFNPIYNLGTAELEDELRDELDAKQKAKQQTKHRKEDVTICNNDYYDSFYSKNRTANQTPTKHRPNTDQTNKKKVKKDNNNTSPPNPPMGDGVKAKVDSLNSKARKLFEDYFRETFGNEYYWEAKDAGNMSKLLDKLKFQREQRGLCCSDDGILEALEYFLRSITDGWIFENFSVSNINSKFNEILSQIRTKNGKNKQHTNKSSADIDRLKWLADYAADAFREK